MKTFWCIFWWIAASVYSVMWIIEAVSDLGSIRMASYLAISIACNAMARTYEEK